jgi:hypothetical protein
MTRFNINKHSNNRRNNLKSSEEPENINKQPKAGTTCRKFAETELNSKHK